MNICLLSAENIRNKVRNGELSAEEVTRAFLQRIDQADGDIGAFLRTFGERAIAQAQKIDQKRATGESLGPLAGVPVGIKDNIHIEGELSTCASRFLTNYRPPFSSTVTRLIEEADGVLIGKTNLDEFAMGSSTENSALQKTVNPWNYACSPGGSSGGSAAAVAARFCPLSLGSDTGGSIRQPASFSGVVGMKPTYGRVSRYGLVAFGSSLDQIGPFAHNVRDAGLLMEVIGKHCDHDSTSVNVPAFDFLNAIESPVQGMRVGVPWNFLQDLASDQREYFEASLQHLKDEGMEVVEVDLDLLRYSIAVYYIVATAEASTNLARFDGIRFGQRSPNATNLEEVYDLSREEGFGFEVKRRILLGTYVLSAGYQDAYYRKAQRVRTLIIRQFKEAFRHCDVVAMPTCPSAAFERGAIHDPLQMYLADLYTICCNLAGLPGLSVPGGLTEKGLPVGFQVIGPQLEDVRICRVARALERRSKWSAVPSMVKEML